MTQRLFIDFIETLQQIGDEDVSSSTEPATTVPGMPRRAKADVYCMEAAIW